MRVCACVMYIVRMPMQEYRANYLIKESQLGVVGVLAGLRQHFLGTALGLLALTARRVGSALRALAAMSWL